MSTIDRQQAFSGTKEAAPALRLDSARLEHYLTANVKGFAGPLTVQQFKGGQSNPTYLLQTPARRYVLRRKPPGKLLPSAHAVDREFRVIHALHAQHFPVAEPLAFCADESVAGTPFYVMSFADGRVFWEPHMPGSNPAERAAVYDAMNGTIARLHKFDPAAIGLADFGRGENYVARQVERWSKQYRASETEKIDAMERLIEWLPRHIPPNGPPRLVHGDYRLDNLIVAKDRAEIIVVLDWELSTLGDPLADFTYHLMAWHMPHSESAAGTASLVGHDLAALGIPSMADYITAYVARTGLDPRPHLAAYLAYNFFRIAAILQGIIGRVPRRHRDIRIRAGQGRDGSPARRQSLGISAGSIEDSFPLRRAETYALDRVADHSLHRRHDGCERVGNREGYGGALQKQVHYPATHRTNYSTICLDK